jgi:DNA-binding response OmpR family regulator
VTVLASGEEGLQHVKAHGADLLILDVNLPGMNGFDVCAALRNDPGTARLPVLMLTVNQKPQDVARGLKSGADDYLHKPFTPTELRARVFALLRRGS